VFLQSVTLDVMSIAIKFKPYSEERIKRYRERKQRIDLLYAMSDVRESNVEKRKKQGRMP